MELGQPNRAAAASLVFCHVGDDAKTCGFQQIPVFGSIKAGVIQGLSFKATNGLAMCRSTREHQSGVWRGVRPENREHPPVIFVAQMKEAVPGENAMKEPPERQRPHV